ncbi:hypothetical protein [Enterobacter hormaechei]|uniref:hypothetical protein n=1 Tax=Enterobacter hormaechei TaxID=158836 RepID=UPI0007927E26|nr:hypothetical protein [Enterobacter hormaechei]EAO5102683.1 hypothetical protein [Salmonella enterica]EIJ5197270.1 hypothetical protein [Salmonella enterica]CZZ74151.1 Uncharacterised protein [Enterobacter hormaechei]HCT4396132.1 hypothetical protein [Escherichia coli]
MERTTAAKVINAVSLVAMLAVMWQAVRFVMGDIGNPVAPVFEFVIHTMREGAGLPSEAPASVLSGGPFRGLLEGFQSLMTWAFGFAIWLVAALIVGHSGKAAARVVLIGWQQYRAEQREAREAARIAAERQAIKDRRRELRRKVIEAREPRKSSGFGPFLIGLLLGSFFF